MVASCATRGFEATSVEDLLRAAGVSRATFYEQFDGKADCFRAAEDEIVAAALAAIGAELRGADGLEGPRVALSAFVGMAVAEPAAARMCLVESWAAGESGMEPVREAVDDVVALVREAVEKMPGRAGMPAKLVRGVVSGAYQVVYVRLLEGRERELPDVLPELWDWAASFPPPPRPLRRPTRLIVSRPVPAAPPFASYSAEQRIIRGFAAVVAAKGYPATTIADVAAAAISQTTFYEHFDAKESALRAALDSSGAQMLAAVMPAVRRTADWRVAVRIGFEEICAFFAAEPAFAALRMVEVYGGGPEATADRDATGRRIVADLLRPPRASGEALSDLVVEATVGAILGVFFEAVREGTCADLPRLSPIFTYFALAPMIGAEEACEVATGRGRA